MSFVHKKRLFFIVTIISIFAIIVTFRFIYLAFLENGNNTKHLKQNNILSLRGSILDRNGRSFVINEPSYSVFANPKEFKEKEITNKLKSLAKLLGISERALIEKFNLDKSFNWVRRKVSKEVGEKIKSLNMRGIFLQEGYSRRYLYNTSLSHILGFVNIDNRGIEGIEYSFDDVLTARKVADSSDDSLFEYGNNIYLTIDYDLQRIAEKVIKEGIRDYDAKSGSVIIMDSSSGEILSFANYPVYNNNSFSKYSQELFRNIGISNYHAPGSIFKVFTAAMLFEEGLIKENDFFFCPGSIVISKRVIKCNKRHNNIHFADIIKKSCNVGIIKASLQIPKSKFYHYLKQFGFGEKTGIELGGENKGLLRHIGELNTLSKAMISFGYEIGVTPMQLVAAASSIANGGLLLRPLIVKKVIYPKGKTIIRQFSKVKIRRVMSKDTASRLYNMLKRVVEQGGTGYKAQVRGIEIAGKTSTTNIYDKTMKAFDKDNVNTSFIGFMPYKRNKMLTVAVFMQKPKKGIKTASYTTAPVFKKLILEILNKGLN